VTVLVDRLGSGISQAVGTGGHDLSVEVGGISMLTGLNYLIDDPETKVIVLISKPPAKEIAAEILGKARARPFLALLGDDVFEAGVPAIAAVAPVAVQSHHRRRRIEQIAGFDKGDRRRQARIGLRPVVRHAVPAAEQKIVPGERGAVEQRNDGRRPRIERPLLECVAM